MEPRINIENEYTVKTPEAIDGKLEQMGEAFFLRAKWG